MSNIEFHGTTICAVKKNRVTAIAGDGQVTMGESVVFKSTAVKVRRIYNGKVITRFAGTVSDAFSLCERLEAMLNKYAGNLERSASNSPNSGEGIRSAENSKRRSYAPTRTVCSFFRGRVKS